MNDVPRPWSLQLEPVKGCTRNCWFCGIHCFTAQERRERKFIDVELVRSIFEQLNDWLPKIRVEMDLRGEPALHPELTAVLQTMRTAMPTASLQLQTNCEPWIDDGWDVAQEWFAAGLNVLALNCYREGFYEHFQRTLPKWPVTWVDYYNDNPQHLSMNSYWNPRKQQVFLLQDLGSVGTQGHVNRRIHNTAGNSNVKLIEQRTGLKSRELPLPNRCTKINRELIVHCDGIVPACCLDWCQELVLGDLNHEGVQAVWEGERMQIVRQLLWRRQRGLLKPCCNCDDPGSRAGLLEPPASDTRTDAALLEVLRCQVE